MSTCTKCFIVTKNCQVCELETKLKEALNGTLLKRYNNEKEEALSRLAIAVACLRELRPVIEQGEDWELGKWIDEALEKIKEK